MRSGSHLLRRSTDTLMCCCFLQATQADLTLHRARQPRRSSDRVRIFSNPVHMVQANTTLTQPSSLAFFLPTRHAINQVESVLNRINSAIADREGAERLAVLSEDLWIGEGRLDLASSTRFLGQRKLLKEGMLMKVRLLPSFLLISIANHSCNA